MVQLRIVLQHVEPAQHAIVDFVNFAHDRVPGAGNVQQKGHVVPGGNDERIAPHRTTFGDEAGLPVGRIRQPVVVRSSKMFTFPGGRREYGCSSEFRYSVSIGSFSSRSGQLRSRWWFGSPRFSVPYTNTRRSALWAILARSLSDHMHDGYSTPTPKMRQYGSMLICSPARFVKKMAMAAVFLNDTARKRSRGHQASDCALPPIAKPPSTHVEQLHIVCGDKEEMLLVPGPGERLQRTVCRTPADPRDTLGRYRAEVEIFSNRTGDHVVTERRIADQGTGQFHAMHRNASLLIHVPHEQMRVVDAGRHQQLSVTAPANGGDRLVPSVLQMNCLREGPRNLARRIDAPDEDAALASDSKLASGVRSPSETGNGFLETASQDRRYAGVARVDTHRIVDGRNGQLEAQRMPTQTAYRALLPVACLRVLCHQIHGQFARVRLPILLEPSANHLQVGGGTGNNP
uniref:Uncharacterized protein n=1 Tax=Anopheles arabiensis TaxID=7173 RepID=A0A182I618_ANOAR